ncbi:Monocarboxylate transporter 2 [Paragonimus heterotremus]|uniref:Monocarboxylate transporter 2 n=1 Tax=Paragonimus heterotremus TaxID=100268 RepID=A0A8J4WRL0_9TREM|nr:Monocarboxylate transporter 2 [Paragonimus heterotremus]
MTTFYVDRGMAWCTVAGGFVANFLLGGLAKSYGLVMEAFQEEFQSGSAYLLLAGGLIYTLMYCLSLVNHYISQRYGSRPVVVAGALGSCISLLVAAFSPNLALWVVAIGVGVGASLSCIYFTVFSVVGRCFRRYLGLANGISVAGVSVGQMAFPSLLTYLNEVYGTRGGTVIMSAICLHLLITAALMPRYIVDPDDPKTFPVPKGKKSKASAVEHNTNRLRRRLLRKARRSPDDTELTADSTLVSMDAVNVEKTKGEGFAHLYTEIVDKQQVPQPMGDVPTNGKTSTDDEKLLGKLSNGNLGSTLSLRTKRETKLAHALLAVYIVAKIFGDIGDVSVSFIAPTHGTKLGLSPVTVSRAIAVSGAVDLVARLGVGWLTDRPGCAGRRGILLAMVWIITGLNALGFAQLSRLKLTADNSRASDPDSLCEPSTQLLVGFFFCFGVHGVCSGTAMTQMVVVLCDWVGSARLSHSLALTMVVLGVLISPGQFAVGYLADVTSNYVWPLRLCMFILLTAGVCLLMEFPVRWFFSRRYGPMEKVNGLTSSTCLTPKTTLVVENGTEFNESPSNPSQCWSVVYSDSETESEQPMHCLQPGMLPVPTSISGTNSVDGHSSALFTCSQGHNSETRNDLNLA